MRPWSPAEVADSAGFIHAQVLGDYVAIPNRRVTQLGADGARSGRPVHWLDCACAAVRWPRSCTVGTGLGPSQAPCRPDGLSSGLPLCTSRETASVCARRTPRSDSKPLRRTTTKCPPCTLPGQRHAGLPPPARARHAAPLRRRVEGAKALTPPWRLCVCMCMCTCMHVHVCTHTFRGTGAERRRRGLGARAAAAGGPRGAAPERADVVRHLAPCDASRRAPRNVHATHLVVQVYIYHPGTRGTVPSCARA